MLSRISLWNTKTRTIFWIIQFAYGIPLSLLLGLLSSAASSFFASGQHSHQCLSSPVNKMSSDLCTCGVSEFNQRICGIYSNVESQSHSLQHTHTRFHCNFINLGFGSNLVGEKARNFPYDKPLSLLTHCWLWNWNSFGGVVVGVAGWLAGSKMTENINGQFSGIPKWNTLALLLFFHLVYISNQFNLKHFGQASHSVGTVCGGQHRFAADSIHKPLCWLLPGRCDVAIVTYVGDNWLWVEVDLEIRAFNR